MRKYLIILSTLIALLPFRYYKLKFDGIRGELLGLVFITDTEYARSYTDKNFSKIKVGISKSEVIEYIGDPLSVWENEREFLLNYSRSPKDTHYRIRQVSISKQTNQVTEVYTEFYVD